MRRGTDDVVELTRDLIRIDSSNPDLASGGGESAIADLVTGWLEPRGFRIQRLEQQPGKPSVLAVAEGTGGGRSLMLNGHLDTVSLAGYDDDPLDLVIATLDDSPIVAAASRAIAEITGGQVPIRGEAFWTDGVLLSDAGIDTVLFAVKGGGAHAATEWVDLESLQHVTRALTTLAATYCA